MKITFKILFVVCFAFYIYAISFVRAFSTLGSEALTWAWTIWAVLMIGTLVIGKIAFLETGQKIRAAVITSVEKWQSSFSSFFGRKSFTRKIDFGFNV